jgi:hypothetical protein
MIKSELRFLYISNIFQLCLIFKVYMRDKKAKFVELANNRVNRTIKDLRLIGNLSNRASYEYSDEDAKKIIRALQREIDDLKLRFRGEDQSDDNLFAL